MSGQARKPRQRLNKGSQVVLKRAVDVLVSSVAMVVASPFLAVIALIIAAKSGMPIIFRQERTGLAGDVFMIYKLRTMDGQSGEARVGDADRLTPVGRFLRRSSLDELPELLNVLKGEMSVVGPRPLLPEYLPLYTPEQARRQEVKPGITGWAQVNGRNALSWEEKFALDVWYVDNWSLALDLKILWMTIVKVIKRDGISAEGHATMPRFTGSREQSE